MFCRDGTVEDEVWMRLLEPYRQGLAVGNHDRSLPAVRSGERHRRIRSQKVDEVISNQEIMPEIGRGFPDTPIHDVHEYINEHR